MGPPIEGLSVRAEIAGMTALPAVITASTGLAGTTDGFVGILLASPSLGIKKNAKTSSNKAAIAFMIYKQTNKRFKIRIGRDVTRYKLTLRCWSFSDLLYPKLWVSRNS